MTTGPREHLHIEGLASMADLHATIAMLVGAVMANKREEVEELTRQAHEQLDRHINAKVEAIAAIREAIKREFNGR